MAASTHDVDSTLASVRLLVLLAALVAAAAGGGRAGVVDAPRASTARQACAARQPRSSGRATRAVDCRRPESDDEIGRLAQTLNGMLSALERSRDAERRFLADASHELRTPLTALVGNVDYLARHGATDELVAELEQDTRRIARLADDLLALSREEAASPPDDVVSLDELASRGPVRSLPRHRHPSSCGVTVPRSNELSRISSRTRDATDAARSPSRLRRMVGSRR